MYILRLSGIVPQTPPSAMTMEKIANSGDGKLILGTKFKTLMEASAITPRRIRLGKL